MITIRLSRRGRKGCHSFAIVVATSKKKRDGKFIEKLGHFNPISRATVFSIEKIRFWEQRGATITEAVGRILKMKIS